MRAFALPLALLLAACAADGPRTPDMPGHHTAGGFRNPPPAPDPSAGGLIADRLRLVFVEVPGAAAPVLDRAAAGRGWAGAEDPVMWLGHGGVMLRLAGAVVAMDPVFGDRLSPVAGLGPRRLPVPPFEAETLPRVDVLLLSHDHRDHLETDSFRRIAERHSAACLIGLRVAARHGLPCEELDWHEARRVGPLAITFLPARHESGRGLFDRNATLWGSWLVEGAGRRVYLGGDSAYGPHYAETRSRHGPPDLAVLNIGGYLPRDPNAAHHASPEETARAIRDLGARRALLIHWGTYPVGAEDTGRAPREVRDAARAAGIPDTLLLTPAIGETIRF
ncbi:MAG: MBL fold metallo-hydrolase [Acetobacteraceae bacterium]|nr:MBL fold metallo-hydrolase [Acetobacteraceae bacterium]